MNKHDLQDSKLIVTINAIVAENGDKCICEKQAGGMLDDLLLREFTPEEIRAITKVAGLGERNYHQEFLSAYFGQISGSPLSRPKHVYDGAICLHVAEMGIAMKAVIAIRQHVAEWAW